MNSYGFLYAVGCILLLLGERMLGDSQLLRYILSITSGILALIGSFITSNSVLKCKSKSKTSTGLPQNLDLMYFGLSLYICLHNRCCLGRSEFGR